METSDRRPASHRRRFLIGLALAALLGAWLGAVLLAGSQQAERRDRAERRALIALSSLTAILDRTSGGSTTEAAPTETAQAPAEGSGMGLGAEIAAAEQGQASTSADARGGALPEGGGPGRRPSAGRWSASPRLTRRWAPSGSSNSRAYCWRPRLPPRIRARRPRPRGGTGTSRRPTTSARSA